MAKNAAHRRARMFLQQTQHSAARHHARLLVSASTLLPVCRCRKDLAKNGGRHSYGLQLQRCNRCSGVALFRLLWPDDAAVVECDCV